MNDLHRENIARVTRRQLFGSAASGVGLAALASLLGDGPRGAGADRPKGESGLPGLPHFAPKAKRVVVLWQGGGPSHVDLFDPKPVMRAMAGKDIPDSVRGTTRLSTMSSGYGKWPTLPAIKPFKKYGQSGIEMSEMLPNVGALADEICLVRSMYTEAVNHAPGVTFFMTGAQVPGRPSMGAWLSYGLGSETDNLPTFVVMTSSDKGKTCGQFFFDYYWGSGFLPSRFQGVRFRNTGDLVPYLANPPGVSREARRALARRHRGDERGPPRRLRRPRDRHAHRPVRDGLPDADERARPGRLLERVEDDARALRPRRPATRHLREQLPDRPPAARTRRPVRAADALRLGPARQPLHAARAAVQGHRRPVGGAGARPEGARDARRHARRLGRRVRPHAVRPGRPRQPHRAATTSARPTAGGSPAAASNPARSTARPTTSPGTSRPTRSTSTTCRRRSCTSAASTTRG